MLSDDVMLAIQTIRIFKQALLTWVIVRIMDVFLSPVDLEMTPQIDLPSKKLLRQIGLR